MRSYYGRKKQLAVLQFTERKEDTILISVTKFEKEVILKIYPEAVISRTVKQKSKRHHYYVEETTQMLDLINKLRTEGGGKS